jgi:hypothetical protein
MKLAAEKNIRITPEVMVNGSATTTDALMGTILKGMLKESSDSKK